MAELEFGMDLFGMPNVDDGELRRRFIEPPFSILDTKQGQWQKNVRKWKNLGIESEKGRDENVLGLDLKGFAGVSIFDPL